MAEYIEREALLKEMHSSHSTPIFIGHKSDEDIMFERMCGIAMEQPTADVVEVVRCKDCEHWDNGDCYRLELSRPYDFCSYGKRKQPTERQSVSLVNGHIDKSNRCVSCGVEIPEGTWTCPSCDRRWQ